MELFGLKGIDQTSASQLITLIQSLSDGAKQQVVQKLADVNPGFDNSKLATSRSNYIARMGSLDPSIVDSVLNNRDQLCDSEIYSVVALGATATGITDLFAPDGAKVVGLRNIANQKLDAGKGFLLHAIEILYGIDASNSGHSATFGTEPIPCELFNGEIELTQNGRKLLSKQSMACFFNGVTASNATTGYYTAKAIHVLDNPKWIYPQEEIKGRMEWGTHPGAANSYVKIRLIGTVNERA